MESLKKFIRSLLIRLKRLVGIEAAEIIVRRFVLRLKLWFRCVVWYRLFEISRGHVDVAEDAMYRLFGYTMWSKQWARNAKLKNPARTATHS